MLCMKEYVTALCFFFHVRRRPQRQMYRHFFMNKSMEGDGADVVWRRRKSFDPLHRINVK
jgi:hypothetical protein